MAKKWLWLFLVVLFLTVDQFTKQWARHNLAFAEDVEIIKGLLHWKLLFNTGAAFSIFQEHTWLLALISVIMSGVLIFYSFQNFAKSSRFTIASLAFLTTGALGNCIDRVVAHKVTDFIDLIILPGNFPIFNVADICINIGIFLFAIQFIAESKNKAD